MKAFAAVALGLGLVSATAAGAGTFGSSQGTFGSRHAGATTMSPPKPPAAPSAPGYKPASDPDRFHPYRPIHTDSTRGGVDAYPNAKKPKGYVSPY